MQYLLQAGPQGLIRIWPTALSEEMNYCSFMVNMTTTSAEIIKLVFEKYELVDDPRRYYVCEMGLGKGGRPLEILSVLYYLYYSFPFPGLKCGLKRKTRKSLNVSKHLLEVSFLVLNNTSMLIFLHHFIRVAFLLNLFYSHIEHLFPKVYSIIRHINRHTVPFHSVDGIILVLSNQDLVNNLS